MSCKITFWAASYWWDCWVCRAVTWVQIHLDSASSELHDVGSWIDEAISGIYDHKIQKKYINFQQGDWYMVSTSQIKVVIIVFFTPSPIIRLNFQTFYYNFPVISIFTTLLVSILIFMIWYKLANQLCLIEVLLLKVVA